MSESRLDLKKFDEWREIYGDEWADVVRDIVETYIETSPAILSELNHAITAGDLAVIVARAHNLKSASSLVTATELHRLLHQIEMLGRDGDLQKIKSLQEKLRSEFDLVAMDLNDFVAGLKG